MEIKKIFLVFFTVMITLLTAMLLNYAAKNSMLLSIFGIGIIFSVLFINFIKFKVWGYVYRYYHLHDSYPMVALFFPLVYVVAIYNKEAVFEWTKVFGISLIILGTFIMNKDRRFK